MEGLNISTMFGGGAILITILFLFFKGDGLDKIKKLFNKNQKDLENKIKELQKKETDTIAQVEVKEKELEEKKKKIEKVIIEAKEEIEKTGTIKDSKKLLEEFNKW